jgi:type IV secretion system protein VirB3
MDREPHEIEEVCFLALTRPVMLLGVPVEGVGINLVFAMLCFILLGIQYGLVGIPLHFLFRAIAWHDHNRFAVLRSWIEVRGRQLNRQYRGGSSCSPARVRHTHSMLDDTHVQ